MKKHIKDRKDQSKYKNCYPEEQQVRKTIFQICELVPHFTSPVNLETEIFKPLSTVDFYTRRQALLFGDIYSVLLRQITSIALTGMARYLVEYDEDDVMEYWASAMDRMLTDIYYTFTQSSIESFLERYSHQTGKSANGSY